MNEEQVFIALQERFQAGNRIVFWHDSQEEFAGLLERSLPEELAGVRVLRPRVMGGLAVKKVIEEGDPGRSFLVYEDRDVPPMEEDWLLDIRRYGGEFRADVASLWLEDLGLERPELREHLAMRKAFLRAKARRESLKKLVQPSDSEHDLDTKMLAVLAGAAEAEIGGLLRAAVMQHLDGEDADLTMPFPIEKAADKYGLAAQFWSLYEQQFGFVAEEPSMTKLLRALFVTDLLASTAAGGEPVQALTHLALPKERWHVVQIFMSQWRDSLRTAEAYRAISAAVASEMNVSQHLDEVAVEGLQQSETFWDTELRILRELRTSVLEEKEAVDLEHLESVVATRQAGSWLRQDSQPARAAADSYQSILAAAQFFRRRRDLESAMQSDDPEALLGAYCDSLHELDRLHRHVVHFADAAEQQAWGLLKSLVEEIELAYREGYLKPLGRAWGELLDAGFLKTWASQALSPQPAFYEQTVAPFLKEDDRRRGFVIISDALRFEAAVELVDRLRLNSMDADCTGMLGVLPSYTALGMASLLPHNKLEFGASGQVLVDGRIASSTAARSEHLEKTVQGIALQASELMGMKTDDIRAVVKGRRVIYIYHNVIDARGDSAATESETFEAVDSCLEELVALVRMCRSKLNASTVWVTADHGFLYQPLALGETDRAELPDVPDDLVVKKKRYVIGKSLGASSAAHWGRVAETGDLAGDEEFLVPRGAGRFHFAGGAKFVHGGAMPQEVVVPLVEVTHKRGEEKEKRKAMPVKATILGSSFKITTPRHRFEILQTEAVGERRLARTVRAAVYEGAEPVTNIEHVRLDSDSEKFDERKHEILLQLRPGEFDKSREYRFVLYDADSMVEIDSKAVTIDRSFEDDF